MCRMRRSGLAVASFVFALALGPTAHADPPAAPLPPLPPAASSSAASAPTPAPPPPTAPATMAPAASASATPAAPAPPPAPAPAPAAAVAPNGVAVVAMPGATDAAWPLAQSVYTTASIRPVAVDEVHARVLCGEAAPASAPGDVRDLADTVAAVRGEDPASRAILADMARKLNVRALVVVHLDGAKPVARVFIPDTQAFDAASYGPDASAGALAWSLTTQSLARTFGGPAASAPLAGQPAAGTAPALATREEPEVTNAPPKPKAFYESGWFWGALGAALFAGGAVYFATRDNGASTIHLDMQVPH
jgi:hypothetical protein